MMYMYATFLAILFVPAVASASFPDVATNHPYAVAIEYVQSTNIVSGYPDGTYRPDQAINRAEFTKIIEGSIPEAENGVMVCNAIEPTDAFSDVKTHEWFWLYVCMAKGRNLIGGYPDGTFRPASLINVAEAAKILYNAKHVDIRGIATESTSSETPWYAPYVRYLREHDAMPQSILSNDQYITRGEMAEMIYRLRTTDSPVSGEAAALKEYVNVQLGFRMSYPSNFSVVLEEDTYDKDFEFILYDEQAAGRPFFEILIVTDNNDQSELVSLLQSEADILFDIQQGGDGKLKIVNTEYKESQEEDNVFGGVSNLYTADNGNKYFIFYSFQSSGPNYRKVFEQAIQSIEILKK